MLKAVLFDLDGVIVDTASDHFKAWQSLAKDLGILIDASFNEKLKGVGRLESLEKILEYGGREKDFTLEEKKVLTDQKNEMYLEFIQRLEPSDIFPGMSQLIEELKNARIPAIITSGSRNALKVLEQLRLQDAFYGIVNLDEVEQGKPYPDIFLKGAELADVEPSACVGIEDATKGIEAIQSAGMCALGVGDSKILSAADMIYSDTRNLTLASIKEVFINWKMNK